MEGMGRGESGAGARVLGRLLADMVVLDAIPSEEGLRRFLEAALQDIPGVQSCRLRLEGARTPGEEGYPSPSRGHWILALAADGETYGAIDLQIDDEQDIAPYRPFLTNLAISLALLLERRRQRDEIMARLQASETMYRSLVDAMGEGVCFQDANGRITAANRAAERILGRSVEQLNGRTSDELQWGSVCEDGSPFPGDEHPFMVTPRTGEPQSDVVMGMNRPDGTLAWISINSQPLALPGETKPHAVVTTFRDITDRKHAEEALKTSQAQLEAAMDLADLVNWELDTDSGIFTFNDRFYALYGTTAALEGGYQMPAEVYVKTFVHSDDQHMVVEAMHKSVETTDPNYSAYLEHRIVRRDGEIRHTLVHHAVIKDKDGRTIKTHGTNQDITERRRTEEALALAEDQLRQSQKMEAVGQLAGGIAHDFNNLLTAIIGYSDLLLVDPELAESSAQKDVAEIRRAAERAAVLTKQILAFSRRQALKPEVVCLNDVVSGMEPLLRRTLGENIDLVTDLCPDLGQSEVDPHQFEQVLMNLAVNARDAMTSGGQLTLETADAELDEDYCRTRPDAEPGSYVMLSVSDTGLGMDEEIKSHIFEPFFTTKPTGEGTGLGLSTVYGIVKQSRGSIFVYSELGKGTTFKIYLPRVAGRETGETASPPERVSGLGTEVVIVVEDEPALRGLIERVLGNAGYKVICFGSADEAMVALAQDQTTADLLLTDIVLPGVLQGNDLARSLHVSRPHLPVVCMSGYTRGGIVHADRLDEGVNFLEKPFTPDALARMVRRVLDHAAR
jgi:two-component system cell cycle sensor histidine kinase/response regulator CckA